MAAARPVLAFLGPPCSYSHQVVLQAFSPDQWTLLSVDSIEAVFAAVQSGAAAAGLVPFENSVFGPVAPTMACLADRSGALPDVRVCGEVFAAVEHQLAGRAAADGSLSHVRRVHSHPQAFGQCAAFVATHLPGAELVAEPSTSRAAELVAEAPARDCAAIASRLAVAAHGLDLLAADIQDRPDNTTRFFVLCPTVAADLPSLLATTLVATTTTTATATATATTAKTLVSFTLPHRTAGALADLLHCFRVAGLNLTSINTLPSLLAPFHYHFLVEFNGHRDRDPSVRQAMQAAQALAETWRCLGSWDPQPIV